MSSEKEELGMSPFLFPNPEKVSLIHEALEAEPALNAEQVQFLTKSLPERFQIEVREKLSFMDRFWAILNRRNWRIVRIETEEGTKLVYFNVRKAIDQMGKNDFYRVCPYTSEIKRKNISSFNVDTLKSYIKRWEKTEKEEAILKEEIRETVRGGIPPLHPTTVEYLTKNFFLQTIEEPSLFQKIRGKWVPISSTNGRVFFKLSSFPSQKKIFSCSKDYMTIPENTRKLRQFFIDSLLAMRQYSDKWYKDITEAEVGLKKTKSLLPPSKKTNQ